MKQEISVQYENNQLKRRETDMTEVLTELKFWPHVCMVYIYVNSSM